QARGAVPVAEDHRLQRAACLLEGAARLAGGDRAPRAAAAAGPRADALAQLVELVLGEAWDQRAGQLAGPGDQAAGRLVAQRRLDGAVTRLEHERAHRGA